MRFKIQNKQHKNICIYAYIYISSWNQRHDMKQRKNSNKERNWNCTYTYIHICWLNSHICKIGNRPMSLGIVPVNWLLFKTKNSIRRLLPSSLGMVPRNSFPFKYKLTPFKLPSSLGMVPVSRLLARLSMFNESLPKIVGIVPVKSLSSMANIFRLLRVIISLGMLPTSCLSSRINLSVHAI